MSKELVIISRPQLPEHWDYDESLKIGKRLFMRWKDITIEMAEHFFIAREILRGGGGDRRSREFQTGNFPRLKKDWGDYCREVSNIEDKDNARCAFNRMLRTVFPLELPEYEQDVPLPASKGLIYKKDALEFLAGLDDESVDLLLTDPPYMTDVDDIETFAQAWLPKALAKIKATGRAYIFIGAYPRELTAYLITSRPEQVLVWEYRNTLGVMPSYNYILNWQAILYYKGPEASKWTDDILLDHTAVQNIGQERPAQHQWQKPVKLAKMFIGQATEANDIIIDPFAGTGTFILQATQMGRRAIGAEIDDEMLKICKRRGLEIRREEEVNHERERKRG